MKIRIMATMAIQAPAANFVSSTMISTAPVIARPIELITRERCMRRRCVGSVSARRCRVQCRIMPVWLSTNETNTPTM